MFHEDLPKHMAYLESVLVKSQTVAQVLKQAPALDVPNWYVGAGAIAQTVWNVLQGYPSQWCRASGRWELEEVERLPGQRGFSVQPRRWVVERSFSWFSHNRRLSKDYERKVQTSETLIQIAMIRLLITRLGQSA
jgi:hypothetical protein